MPVPQTADEAFAAGAAFIEGEYLPVGEARLPLLDWGFIKSDCTYDVVADVRQAFRALGKDPSRYRPSSEALLRRIAQGKGLFNVNNLVDTNNLISPTSRFPAGAYDLARLEGTFETGLDLRVGHDGETYEAIARGPFNLANLPVLCDRIGPFGSPTSDSARTMVTADCREALLVLYGFGGVERLDSALDTVEDALQRLVVQSVHPLKIIQVPAISATFK